MPTNTTHLNAIRLRLSNERTRLASASSESERQLRATWVVGIERELAGEFAFLGLQPDPQFGGIDDDELLEELLGNLD